MRALADFFWSFVNPRGGSSSTQINRASTFCVMKRGREPVACIAGARRARLSGWRRFARALWEGFGFALRQLLEVICFIWLGHELNWVDLQISSMTVPLPYSWRIWFESFRCSESQRILLRVRSPNTANITSLTVSIQVPPGPLYVFSRDLISYHGDVKYLPLSTYLIQLIDRRLLV